MIYSKTKTIAYYWGDMKPDTVQRLLRDIIKDYDTLRTWGGGGTIDDHDVSTNDGILLTGTDDVTSWSNRERSLWFVDTDCFHDGHLQQGCPDIVTVDLTLMDVIRPVSYCQVHSMV